MRLVCSLRGARERSGESLRSVAERSGIFRGHLSEIERGIRLPTDEEAVVLARIYGLAVDNFYADAPVAIRVGIVPDDEQLA
jgi:transcriptional regulator with XRE-family HTH domain